MDNNKENELENKLKEKDRVIREKNTQLRKVESYYKNILDNIGTMGSKNINSITYIISNYEDAPHIKTIEIDNLKKLPFKTDRDIENVISCYRNNTLMESVIDAILYIYKKNDPAKQSVWVTDTSRHNYIIKELLHDNDSKWVIDKKGVKSEQYLVKPILDLIRKKILDYLQTASSLLANSSITRTDRDIIIDSQRDGSDLMKDIDDGILGPEIIKKLAKYIHHEKSTNNPLIEEIE